ncbi:MAG: GAF domain-containing protein [Chloroflexi bacterium]|nr:GAF domain-containing protein [Chloroflexota bacterium]
MKHPDEKNFHIFISLLLEGIGVGLALVPSHLGVASGLKSILWHGLAGMACFFTALALQISTVWELSRKKMYVIRGTAVVLLIVVGSMLVANQQRLGALALITAGICQLAAMLPIHEEFKQAKLFHFSIGLVTFVTGIILPFAGYDIPQPYIPVLASGFLITAFLGGIPLDMPGIWNGRQFHLFQALPWSALAIVIAVTGKDNLIAPTAALAMLALERIIPWKQLSVPEDDILSRRVIMIALGVEMSHLIFLGTLLFAIDPTYSNESASLLTAREAALLFFILFSVMIYYLTTTVTMTINALIEELSNAHEKLEGFPSEALPPHRWGRRLDRYIRPFIMTPELIRSRLQTEQVNRLTRQSLNEKKRNSQLQLLLELSQQLENQLDQPVSAQLAVNTLERALNCGLVCIFLHEPESLEFMLIAAAGRQTHLIPTGYRQESSKGALGRALRQRKTQIINDIRMDPDYIPFKDESNLSAAVIPLSYNGHIHGMIAISHEKVNAFSGLEIGLAETVAAELTRAWERSGYHQRLTELIQTGSQLFSAPDPETTAHEVASISRNILKAKFTYIHIQLGQERAFIQHAYSGKAPILLNSLMESNQSEKLIQLALHASKPFRVRDCRKYDKTAELSLDNPSMRSLLVIPIRWHHVNIGAVFAFGKQHEVFFTENDESLAELLAIQASGAFESAWLQQELRASVRITSLLYRLSNQIIQAENIEDAASDIAQTAHRLGKNLATGIILYYPENEIIAEVRIDEGEPKSEANHPMELIRNAMDSGQLISYFTGEFILRTCLPIQTPIRSYGAIWMDAIDDPNKPTNPKEIQDLVNQAAIALERSLLLVESRRQAKEIKAAYDMLEATYDQTLASLSSALDARDRETEGHSVRVTHLALKLGEQLGFPPEQLKILERGSLLHDIGKIGISDIILHKPGPLREDEWKIMKLHPDIGARIVEGIPFLEDTIPLIRCHQERWDGTGYPNGLKGEEIPALARLFSIVDAFDALTSDRPYRAKISVEEALAYLQEQAGTLFDPAIVSSFVAMIRKDPSVILVTQ